jgi:glycosidase
MPVIYSVFARNHGTGGLSAVTADLPRISALGVDYIWLMPFYPVGEKRRKGSAGSPYAIRDYRAVDPELGTMDDFVTLVDAAHAAGLRVIIDIVFNHVAPDSLIAAEHPEWLWKGPDGKPGPRFSEWSDVVDLDCGSNELRAYLIDTLAGWLELGADGFRCDVAPMVPLDFWRAARRTLDALYGHTLWLAESVEPAFAVELNGLGIACASEAELYESFDLCYDYGTFPDFRRLFSGECAPGDYLATKAEQRAAVPAGRGIMAFLENHDNDRAASYIPDERLPAWLAWTLLAPGAGLLFAGQEFGLRHAPSRFEPDPIPLHLPEEAARAASVTPELVSSLLALRRSARHTQVSVRALSAADPATVAIEWGDARRTVVVLGPGSTAGLPGAGTHLPERPLPAGTLPDHAAHVRRQTLAPGVNIVTFSRGTG